MGGVLSGIPAFLLKEFDVSLEIRCRGSKDRPYQWIIIAIIATPSESMFVVGNASSHNGRFMADEYAPTESIVAIPGSLSHRWTL